MIRLERLSPETAERLRAMPPTEQREAAVVACEFVLSHVGVNQTAVAMALECRQQGEIPSTALRTEIEALAARLDDEYFDLQRAADEGRSTREEFLPRFAQARAVTALHRACDDDPLTAAMEAVYEAAIATDQEAALFAAIDSRRVR